MRIARLRPATFSIHGILLGLGFLVAFALSTPLPLYAAVGIAWVAWRRRRRGWL